MFKFHVFAYFGDPHKNLAMKFSVIKKLTQQHHIFDDSAWHNWTIVVSSYSILTQRHELSMQTQWRHKKLKMPEDQIKDLTHILDLTWLQCLHEVFHTLMLNEAHQLCNVNLLQVTAIFWLSAEFNLLLTVMLLFNCVEDFKDLVPLFISAENDALWEKLTVNSAVNLFELDDSESVSVLCLTCCVLEQFIWNNSEIVNDEVSHHISKMWEKCLIHCCLLSRILFSLKNDCMIDDSILSSQFQCFCLKFLSFEQQQYNVWEKQISKNLIYCFHDD